MKRLIKGAIVTAFFETAAAEISCGKKCMNKDIDSAADKIACSSKTAIKDCLDNNMNSICYWGPINSDKREAACTEEQ